MLYCHEALDQFVMYVMELSLISFEFGKLTAALQENDCFSTWKDHNDRAVSKVSEF